MSKSELINDTKRLRLTIFRIGNLGFLCNVTISFPCLSFFLRGFLLPNPVAAQHTRLGLVTLELAATAKENRKGDLHFILDVGNDNIDIQTWWKTFEL